ncbi:MULTISPECIES: AGE family epimerase/isomerase [unclassified Tenacibaculum]|uniref:AGE family epimerase/isomerase n=1 Tax=unclassified Tenacibaculum TaxID=2635139 RepID=UPI001F174ACA|nr:MULTISPECIES: AGE family epimerase/isomerase [unclassified Tenacibaculum]MCF2875028.1 AGE family epimerase/isomerase [Tenacibaculum sp. Cn5-1]MCF2935104.1 AGE family epimerase/isomerase [Tenacibaculum sp. Cn5-34]MCG7511454.1 AGE family epimerase/isomerase [Tenacibaculum sp. Cn5-46]
MNKGIYKQMVEVVDNSIKRRLQVEIRKELQNVLDYWKTNTIDNLEGGFFGRVDSKGNVVPKAPKGIILNARTLWSFSAVCNQEVIEDNEAFANRAYQYLKYFFKDKETSAVYWELYYNGKPIDKTKNTIAQAYTILGLSEYYKLSKKEEVKTWAVNLFEFVEKELKSSDGSYLNEEFKEGVQDKVKKLGTYLHLLEGYSALYKVYDNDELGKRITYLLETIVNKFWKNDKYLVLEFDEQWVNISKTISFGHNAEVPWMLLDIARSLGYKKYEEIIVEKMKHSIANFLNEAVTFDGAVLTGKNIASKELDVELNWWVQTEAMLAFDTLYKETKKEEYLISLNKVWYFVKDNFIDNDNGEWHSKITGNWERSEHKVAMWKTPYHIVRMCLNVVSDI